MLKTTWTASLLKPSQKSLQTSGSPAALGDRRKGEFPSLKSARRSPDTASCRILSSGQGATATHRVPHCASSSQALPSPPGDKDPHFPQVPLYVPASPRREAALAWGRHRTPARCGTQFTRRPDWEASGSLRLRYLMQKSPRIKRGLGGDRQAWSSSEPGGKRPL